MRTERTYWVREGAFLTADAATSSRVPAPCRVTLQLRGAAVVGGLFVGIPHPNQRRLGEG